MLLLVLRFLEKELGRTRMSSCRGSTTDLGELFRLDAKAEGEDVAVGGWFSRGVTRTWDAPWFATKLNRRNAPWAFSRGEAFRTIASLELLGALLGLMVLGPEPNYDKEFLVTSLIACDTDNRSNSFLLDRMITTKYPLGVVLMELAAQSQLRGVSLRARWIPRLQNEEADALSNYDFSQFDPAKRIEVDLETMDFKLLHDLFSAGDDYIAELEKIRKAEQMRASAALALPATKVRKVAGKRLRDTNPW